MIAAAQWLKIWVFSMEVPGSNASKFLLTFFMYLFYPVVTVLLKYFDPEIYSCLVLPCNSVAVNAISFKLQKVLAMMVNLQGI